MKPTHFAVRDLHAQAPGDYLHPAWDVLALIGGNIFYSEDIYDTLGEAEQVTNDLRSGALGQDWDWSDNVLPPKGLDGIKPRWLPSSPTIKEHT